MLIISGLLGWEPKRTRNPLPNPTSKVHKPAVQGFRASWRPSRALASENVLESVLKASWAACGGVPGVLIFLGLPGKGKAGAPKRRETHYQTQHPDHHKQASEARRPSEAPGGPDRPPRPPGGAWRHPGAPPRPAGTRFRAENEGTRGPRKPPEAPEAPGRFRSSEGHDRKSPQPFRKILKGYRSARDKTLDQSQADKGGSGNLGRQPETRKGIKLGGCLRKQGVGKRNQHTSSWFVAHERCAVASYAAPPHPWVCRGAISTCDLQPPRGETP